MRNNYYPWNVQALTQWLTLEQSNYSDTRAFAAALDIPISTLRVWKSNAYPTIDQEHLLALARYRQSSLEAVLAWLEINPVHLEPQLAQAAVKLSVKALGQQLIGALHE